MPSGHSATKLTILTLNYSPEPTGFAPHATALAEHLSRHGHKVTVVTGFPFAPRWKRWPEYRGVFSSQTMANGVTLERVSHFIPRRPGSVWQRVVMEVSFVMAAVPALWRALRDRRARPDAVVYIGAQPAIAMLARVTARIARASYFVNINDLAAQAAADVGIVRAGWIRRILERFEYAAYSRAAGASVLCQSFADALVERGYPASRIRLIRSPIDLDRIRPLPSRPEYRQQLGIPIDAFVVMFAGSMGLKQGLAHVVDAARRSDSLSRPVRWVLVGDGEMRQALQAEVDRHRLHEVVRLLPFQPAERLSEMFAAADVLLLSQVASVKDTVVPSKLLTYMAAGRPVLAAVNHSSQGAEILRDADGGLLVAPEDPDALLRGVDALMAAGREMLAATGNRNRAYAERHFDQRTILAAHESFILERMGRLQRERAAAVTV